MTLDSHLKRSIGSSKELLPDDPCSMLKYYTRREEDHHHHHQVPDLEQTLATMPLQTSLSSDNFKKFKPLLCPPVAELQRLSRNVIRCLPLSRLPSTLPVKDKNSKPLRLHTCPKNSICLFLIVFNSDL